MFLLDTDIATLLMHEHERVLANLARQPPDRVVVRIITRIEILRGRFDAVLKAASRGELIRATEGLSASEATLALFRIVPLSDEAADTFDELRVNKKLKKVGRGDLLQAAIALANRATLVTRNTKDYANVPGLKLENWAD